MKKRQFLSTLQEQASQQAKLSQQRWLPSSVDWLTSLVGNYPWQIGVVLAGVLAALIEGTK
jgi:hypothetical protein